MGRKRVSLYAMATILFAAAVGAAFGPFSCNEIFGCMGGHPTTKSWLLAVLLGAIVGLLVAAAVDMTTNMRYLLANRAEAKARRRREETRSRPPDDGA